MSFLAVHFHLFLLIFNAHARFFLLDESSPIAAHDSAYSLFPLLLSFSFPHSFSTTFLSTFPAYILTFFPPRQLKNHRHYSERRGEFCSGRRHRMQHLAARLRAANESYCVGALLAGEWLETEHRIDSWQQLWTLHGVFESHDQSQRMHSCTLVI